VDSKFVGLNATSELIEVAVRPLREAWKTGFTDECIMETADRLKRLQPQLVVMEAAGSFELPVAGILATYGLPFAIVNPRSVREFARAAGKFSRSEYAQAELLAYFGELVHPEPRPLPEELIEKLRCLRSRRENVLEMLHIEKANWAAAPADLRKDIQRHIYFLEQNISSLNQEFNRAVRASAAWR
jgi:transposase